MNKLSLSSFILSTLLYVPIGYGAGFAIQEQSASALGRAVSGSAAIAENANTIFYNPAGLSYIQHRQLTFGSNFIIADSQYTDNGSTTSLGTPMPGREGDINFFVNNSGNYAFLPSFFYAHRLNQQWVAGIGVTSPYGLSNEYDDDWFGRYHAIRSSLIGFNINPSIAFKPNEKLSIGFGISSQYSEIELSNAVDFGSLCAGEVLLTGNPALASCATPLAHDGKLIIDGDDWAWGYNFGVIYQANNATRLGMAYRSMIAHNFKGRGNVTIPDSATAINNGVTDYSSADTFGSLRLPETISASIFHQLDTKWSLTGDITWTKWSRFQSLDIQSESTNPLLNTSELQNWKNSFRLSIGMDYRYSAKWTFRTGFAYDETPIRKAERGARIPGGDRRWISIGSTYTLSPQWQIDMAYAHVFFRDNLQVNSILDPQLPHQLNGEYNVSTDIISIQLNWSIE